MSRHEVGAAQQRRIFSNKKIDPLLTIAAAVAFGVGGALIYRSSFAPSLIALGTALVIGGGVLLAAGGWRTIVP